MSDPVDATTFVVSYENQAGDSQVERSVRAVALDRFEVVVGRFSEFLLAYDSIGTLKEGVGAAPGVLNSGWKSSWSDDPRLMPPDMKSLHAGIQACGAGWDADPITPVRCVNWYVAAAFCIWDGGRLPSEAEWMAAALGGGEQREYPWTTPEASEPLDQEHACYYDMDHMWDGPQRVGFRPRGAGRFEHHDLIGNVQEWLADVYHETLPVPDCASWSNRDAVACKQESDTQLRVAKGGSFGSTGARLTTTYRGNDEPSHHNPLIGFRCARELEDTNL